MSLVKPTSTTPAGSRSPRLVTRRVLDELGRRILAGFYPQQSVLPTELQLCEEFGVSRTALREAAKMLAAKGMVVARRRAGTIVQEASLWNRLDADVLSWSDATDPDPTFVRGLVEARLAIEPAAADLAAQRATASDLAAIEAGFFAMRAADPADLAAFAAADIDFHVGVLNASHNPVFTGLANLIGRALRSSVRLTTPASGDHRRAVLAHGEVFEAIRLRQPELARSRMRALIDIAALDLSSASVLPGGEPLARRLHISDGLLSAAVVPELGAGLARLDYMVGDQPHPLLRPEPPGGVSGPLDLGLQVLVPWSNRVSSGGFIFSGKRHELHPNVEGEPFPIHGSGFSQPWNVVSAVANAVSLSLDSDGPAPFSYRAGLTYSLQADSLRINLALCNTGDEPLPFGLGFHPWFVRSARTELQARSTGVWRETPQHLPLGAAPIPLPAEWDFDRGTTLPQGFINNAFVDWDGHALVRWLDFGLQMRIEASPVLSTYILYSPGSHADYFCFEPVSHPVDAFNLGGPPEAHGLVVLAPGKSVEASVTLAVEKTTIEAPPLASRLAFSGT